MAAFVGEQDAIGERVIAQGAQGDGEAFGRAVADVGVVGGGSGDAGQDVLQPPGQRGGDQQVFAGKGPVDGGAVQAGAAGGVRHADPVDAAVAELGQGRVEHLGGLRVAFDVGGEPVGARGCALEDSSFVGQG
nr:hypothetical protein [Nocardia abscessus]